MNILKFTKEETAVLIDAFKNKFFSRVKTIKDWFVSLTGSTKIALISTLGIFVIWHIGSLFSVVIFGCMLFLVFVGIEFLYEVKKTI